MESTTVTRTRTGLLLAVCGLTLAACVSQGKYADLEKVRNALAEQNNTLAEQNKSLAQNIDDQKGKLSSANDELQRIKAKTEEQEAMFAKLQKELASELDSKKLTLRQMKDGISVDLPEDILFASGSADLRDSGREVLAKVSEQLQETKYQVVVSGYTDNVPISGKLAKRYPTNWDLAAARATNVARLLEENKVPGNKLIAASFGENNPVADNSTAEGRKQNRRIEIHLRPVVAE